MEYNYTKSFVETRQPTYDMGLRKYMIAVFQYMAYALIITAIVSMGAASSDAFMNLIFNSPLKWLIIIAPVIMAFYMGSKITSISEQSAQTLFAIFSGLMGLSMSNIFIIYTGESIARVFFITASTFGVMSLYGYQTSRDLTSMGSFLFMGIIGLFIAGLVNIFMQSSAMQLILSFVGVIVFTLFTAYDVQRIKEVYYQSGGNEYISKRLAIYGALSLYMDFINLFVSLLQFFGVRKGE